MKKLLIVIFILIILFICFYQKEENILYISDFLSTKHFNLIKKNLNYENFKSENFRNIKPLNNKLISNIFYSPFYLNKINKLIKKKLFKSEFPIEHRIYPTGSEGMRWHIDTLLYEKPQYEAVFTINNTSDSYTKWFNGKRIMKKYTEPNSLLLVKANGDYHKVTPVNKGIREILKIIYTQTKRTNKNYDRELKRFN